MSRSSIKKLSGSEFRKDYTSYLLGIIIPASVNFLTIPFFKQLLGSANFGIYSFYFSILLIINSSFSGGITQSIIRLHVEHADSRIFFIQSMWLTLIIQFVVLLPLFFYIQFNQHLLFFSFLFSFSLFLANTYTTLLAITQAGRLSKYSAIAESLKTILILGLSIILLSILPNVFFLNILFISIVISYATSSIFLFIANQLSINKILRHFDFREIKKLGKAMIVYGGYLVAWFFFSFGISSANRFVLAHFLGKEQIGNYTASFDILYRSISVLLSPVLISLFPLIVRAFAQGDMISVSNFIRKLTLVEVGMAIISIVVFLLFGFKFLSAIIKTPLTNTYLYIDVQVIVSSYIWQIAMLQHKFLELNKKTHYMLFFVVVAFLFSIMTDLILISNFGIAFASVGFLVGGIVYLGCVLYYRKFYLYKSELQLY